MSKGNRAKGTAGRFDFGESGYIDNIRRKGEIHAPIMWTPYMRLCCRCGDQRPRKGGILSRDGRGWTCGRCRKARAA